MKKRIHIVNDLMKTKANEIDWFAWHTLHSMFTAIERAPEIKGDELVLADNILKAVLVEVHELNTDQRSIHANTFVSK